MGTLLVGILASMCVDLGQELFLPERFATTKDVLANALGAAIGTVIVYGLARCHDRDAELR